MTDVNPSDAIVTQEDGVRRLAVTFSEAPTIEVTIHQLLERTFARPITPDTMNVLGTALLSLVGPANTLLLQYLCSPEPETRLDELRPLLDRYEEQYQVPLTWILRKLQALYGLSLVHALDLWNEDLNDWRNFTREVLRNEISGTTVLRLTVEKYNGEVVFIQGAPNSIARLVRNIVKTLNLIPERGSVEAELIQDLEMELQAFVAQFGQPAIAPSAELAATDSGSGDTPEPGEGPHTSS
jgi:hypothetical protein